MRDIEADLGGIGSEHRPTFDLGKYRVGVITALIRRLQGWSMTSLYDEYARFAGSDRIADEEVRCDVLSVMPIVFPADGRPSCPPLRTVQFIDMFPLASVRHEHHNAPDWLPS